MRIQERPVGQRLQPVRSPLQSQSGGPVDGFQKNDAPPPPSRTSWFHRASGAIAGGTAGAILGTLALAPLGNGKGAEGLVYALAGLAGGGLTGVVAGSVAAGHFHSQQGQTSLFHRASGTLAGGMVGSVVSAAVLSHLGDGRGAEGLVYALGSALGGGAVGAAAGFYAAGRFPDR